MNATVTLTCRGDVAATWTQDIQIGNPLILEAYARDRGTGERARCHRGSEWRSAAPLCAWRNRSRACPHRRNGAAGTLCYPTNEELYLTGLHLAQYRHATRRPELYWQEALSRDAFDARANTALGEWHMQRGEFTTAEDCCATRSSG